MFTATVLPCISGPPFSRWVHLPAFGRGVSCSMRSDTKPKIFRMTIIRQHETTYVPTTPMFKLPPAPRGLPARRRGRICAQYRARDAGKAVANRRPDRRAHHSRLRPPAHAPAPSALHPRYPQGPAPELRHLRAAHTGGGCERRAQVACGRGGARVGGVRGEMRAAAAP